MTKDIKLRPAVAPSDFQIKAETIARYLKLGDSVKVTVMMRGREIFHPELAKKIIDRLEVFIDDAGELEDVVDWDGRNMVATFVPSGGTSHQPALVGV